MIDRPQATRENSTGPTRARLDSQRRNWAHWRRIIILAVVSVALGLLFHAVSKLLAANAADPVAQFIEHMTGPFLEPFIGFSQVPSAAGKELETAGPIVVAACVILYLLMIRMRGVFFDRVKARGAAKTRPDLQARRRGTPCQSRSMTRQGGQLWKLSNALPCQALS